MNYILNLLIFTFIFIFNLIVYDFLILSFDEIKIIENGIFSPDAWLFHINTFYLLNAENLFSYFQILYNFYLNYLNIYPLILSFLYLFSDQIYLVILFNSLIISIFIYKLQKFINLFFKSNFFYLPSLLVIFNPIIILSTIQPLKENLILLLSIILFIEMINRHNQIFKFRDYLNIKILLVIISLFFLRFYQPLLIIFPFISFKLLKYLNLKIPILKYKYLFFLVLFFLVISIDKYLPVFKYFFDYRNSFLTLNHSNEFLLSLNSNHYYFLIDLIKDLPTIIFLGIIEPLPFFFYNGSNSLYNLFIIFHFICLLFLIGNIYFFKFRVNNILFLLFSILTPIILISILIPNLGTALRIKSFFWIIITISGFIGWTEFIFYKLKLNKFYDEFVNKNNDLIFSILFSFLSLLLLILRDFYVIKQVNFDLKSDFFYIVTFSVSIISYALTSPLYEIFNSSIDHKRYKFINIILFNSFLSSFVFIIIVLFFLFLIFSNDFLIDLSNRHILLSLLLLPSSNLVILTNVIISNKLKPNLVVFGNILAPLTCILFILFFEFNLFLLIVYGLLIGQLLNLVYNFLIILNFNSTKSLIIEILNQLKFKNIKLNLKYFNYLYINIFLLMPFLLSNLFIIKIDDGYLTYWILFSKIIFTLFFFLIGLININFLSSLLFKKSRNTISLNPSQIINEIQYILFIILVFISVFLHYSLDTLLNTIIIDIKILQIIKDLKYYILVTPFLVYVFTVLKLITSFQIVVNNRLLLIILILLTFINCMPFSISQNINFFILIIFYNYFLIIFFIHFLINSINTKFIIWFLLNFLIINFLYIIEYEYEFLLLLTNIFFVMNKKLSFYKI